MKKQVTMKKSAFIKEHKKLVKVLKSGNKKKLRKEASSQGKELKKFIKNYGKR